ASLIGDPVNGLTIPGATNAALTGVWRVVDLPQPLMLQPGFYELGGVDSRSTTDVIKYVSARPGASALTPLGSPVSIGALFYAAVPHIPTNFAPTTLYYLAWGLELGPMLFGTNSAPLGPVPALSIRRIPHSATESWIVMTWPAGTLVEADDPA